MHSVFQSFSDADESHLVAVVFDGLDEQEADTESGWFEGAVDGTVDADIERDFHSLETVGIRRTSYLSPDVRWAGTGRETMPSLMARGILRLTEK